MSGCCFSSTSSVRTLAFSQPGTKLAWGLTLAPISTISFWSGAVASALFQSMLVSFLLAIFGPGIRVEFEMSTLYGCVQEGDVTHACGHREKEHVFGLLVIDHKEREFE